MGLFSIVNHLVNFLLPAFAVGILVALSSPWLFKRPGLGLLRQSLLNSLVGTVALATGLWFFGTDAKMATYLGLVLLVGSTQWLSIKGWRG